MRRYKVYAQAIDPINQYYLVSKAMAFEEELILELIRRLKTSLNDSFIETAIRILAKSKKDIAKELMKQFDDMRKLILRLHKR